MDDHRIGVGSPGPLVSVLREVTHSGRLIGPQILAGALGGVRIQALLAGLDVEHVRLGTGLGLPHSGLVLGEVAGDR